MGSSPHQDYSVARVVGKALIEFLEDTDFVVIPEGHVLRFRPLIPKNSRNKISTFADLCVVCSPTTSAVWVFYSEMHAIHAKEYMAFDVGDPKFTIEELCDVVLDALWEEKERYVE